MRARWLVPLCAAGAWVGMNADTLGLVGWWLP